MTAPLPHPLTGKPVCPWCRRESPPPEHACHDALEDAMTRIEVLEAALRAALEGLAQLNREVADAAESSVRQGG